LLLTSAHTLFGFLEVGKTLLLVTSGEKDTINCCVGELVDKRNFPILQMKLIHRSSNINVRHIVHLVTLFTLFLTSACQSCFSQMEGMKGIRGMYIVEWCRYYLLLNCKLNN